MGIKANFSIADVQKDMAAKMESIVEATVQALVELGRECVDYARSIPPEVGFNDVTGNLRSSIGFKVFRDGTPVAEDYVQVLNGAEGVEKGRALADQIGSKCGQNQTMLVITAGEEYAVYLESKGRDVLTSSELMARREWPQMKQRIDEIIRRQAS